MDCKKKIIRFFERHDKKILWFIIAFFILIIFAFLLNKYQEFGYNALDLGIYNQVFYNSSQGNLFAMSIHPHSYLGDHFEIFILLLLPFYIFCKSPLTLLFLQTLFIGLSAWPLFLIAKKYLPPIWVLSTIIVYLMNPLVLNILFFEFHILPFAIFTLFFTFFFYRTNKFIPFLIFAILSILIREDVALVIMMFGILAAIEKKNIKWIITPLVLGGAWFIMALKLTGLFNQSGDYKFLSMYGWIGGSLPEMIYNILAHPLAILKQILSLNNILSLIAIFIPLFALPLLKPKYFVPIILVAIQLLLLSPSTSILIETHYTALLIPFIFIALVSSLSKIKNNKTNNPIFKLIIRHQPIILILFLATFLYSFITLSPIWTSLTSPNNNYKKDEFIKEKIKSTTTNENIITSFDFLPNLSGREQVYSLHYLFLGKKQFSQQDFNINVPIDKAFIDFDDFTIYYLQTKYNQEKKELYPTGADRVKSKLRENNLELTSIFDSYAYYEKNAEAKYKLVEFNQPKPDGPTQQINHEIKLNAIEKNPTLVEGTLALSFYWEINNPQNDDYFIILSAKDGDKKIYKKIYPLGYLIYPMSDWPINENIKTNYWFYLPDDIKKDYTVLEFQLVKIINGRLKLDGQRTATISISDMENIGNSFEVNYNTL